MKENQMGMLTKQSGPPGAIAPINITREEALRVQLGPQPNTGQVFHGSRKAYGTLALALCPGHGAVVQFVWPGDMSLRDCRISAQDYTERLFSS